MIEPAEAYPEDTVLVDLAGRQWPVPVLVWRDLKKCRNELIELNGKINEAFKWLARVPAPDGQAEDGKGTDDKVRAARNMQALGGMFDALSNEDFDRLVMGPILAALQSLHPKLTREEFEGWRTSETERQMALLVVRRQSGLFTFGEAADDEPGEAAGDTQPPSRTGSASSCAAADITATPANTGGET